jgi:hypothetical protein
MNDTGTDGNSPFVHFAFFVEEPFIERFFLLLQQGVRIRRRVGCSVDDFLRKELEVGPEALEKIQSIILDGKPVDDIGSALIHDGSVLALSAAMPGLVGATLRRGGAYSSLRNAITYHEEGKADLSGEGWVSVKLFNLMMAELGPGLLRNGVLVHTADLSELLAKGWQEFRKGCTVTLEGKPVEIGMWEGVASLQGNNMVFLTVTTVPVND